SSDLAATLARHGIDRWLAQQLLALSRGSALPAAFMLALATALLSMWISNTATAAMMLPLALGLSAPLADRYPRYRLFLLLALAWSANVGGMGTLEGSPPNAITAAALGWAFYDWRRVGLPGVAVLLPVALLVLYFIAKPESDLPKVDTGAKVHFPQNAGAYVTLGVFALTVVLWIGGSWFGE